MNGAIREIGKSYKTGKEVTCATPECSNKFIKNTPMHKYCKQCAADRQHERSMASSKNTKKRTK